jgi:hypothetical protein
MKSEIVSVTKPELLSVFRARLRNARAVIAQIRAGEWEFQYNHMAQCCCTAIRDGRELWVGNGAFFCDMRYGEPAFGLILRHWVWHAAARKECARVKAANVAGRVPDLSSQNATGNSIN